MTGGIEETSASFEVRSAPRSYPTVHSINPPSPRRNKQLPIASGVTEDNPQGHPATQTIPAFYYRFVFFTVRLDRRANELVRQACLANSRRRVAAASQSHPDSSAPGEVERAGRELAAERGLAFAPVQGFQPGPMACRCSRIRLVVKYGRDAR